MVKYEYKNLSDKRYKKLIFKNYMKLMKDLLQVDIFYPILVEV